LDKNKNRADRDFSEIIRSYGLYAAVFWFRNWDYITVSEPNRNLLTVGSGQTALTG